jgi:hypothetical protein
MSCRDYVDGKLIPRKNPPAPRKSHRAQSNGAGASTETPDPGSRRRSIRRGSQQEAEDRRSSGPSLGEGYEMDHYADSEWSEGDGLDRSGDLMGDDGVGEGEAEGLTQHHLPMKKRFAVPGLHAVGGEQRVQEGEQRGRGLPGLAGYSSGKQIYSGGSEDQVPNSALAGVPFDPSEKELAEWALAHKYSEEAKESSQRARPGATSDSVTAAQPKAESISEQGPGGTANEGVAGSHAPVRVTLGELPDAFLRAQEEEAARSDAHADAGMRERPHRPESSMSPRGESLKRVGMIVEALAGGLDHFGYAEDGPAEAQEGHVQKTAALPGTEAEPAAVVAKVKVDEAEPKVEFKRCIMSGGTGWKCGRPRIDDSKYCQYHFELRRKQRLNSGARAAKGVGKRKSQVLKRSTRSTPKASKAGQNEQPGSRKRRLPKAEPVLEDEQEAYPFLSVEFRLQKRTRTKKAVRPHTAVDRLLLAAKVRREDSLELLADHQTGRQHLRCFQGQYGRQVHWWFGTTACFICLTLRWAGWTVCRL